VWGVVALMARNHEFSAFAVGVAVASTLGASPVGMLGWGLVCAYAGDLPDIDSSRTRIVKMLCLVPYRVPALDKDGNQRRRKPKPVRVTATGRGPTRAKAKSAAKRKARRKAWWLSARRAVGRAILGAFLGVSEPPGELMWTWRTFPGHQLHRLSVRASEAVYDRYATEADRRDVVPHQGPRFRSHRGLTHSLWAALVVGVLGWIVGAIVGWVVSPTVGTLGETVGAVLGPHIPLSFGIILVSGMLAHDLGDGCTDMGISLLAPVVPWRGRRYPVQGLLLEPFRFKTGQLVEDGPVTWACTGMAMLAIPGAFGLLNPLLGLLVGLWTRL
jgi:hypothetical protein